MTEKKASFPVTRTNRSTKFTNENYTVFNAIENDYCCDTVLKIEENIFPSFRNVLVENNKVFAFLYEQRLEEWNDDEEINDVRVHELDSNLNPIHFHEYHKSFFTKKIDLTSENALGIANIANDFDDDEVFEICREFAMDNMTIGNIFDLIDDFGHDQEYFKAYIDFIKNETKNSKEAHEILLRKMKVQGIERSRKFFSLVIQNPPYQNGCLIETILTWFDYCLKQETLSILDIQPVDLIKDIKFSRVQDVHQMRIYKSIFPYLENHEIQTYHHIILPKTKNEKQSLEERNIKKEWGEWEEKQQKMVHCVHCGEKYRQLATKGLFCPECTEYYNYHGKPRPIFDSDSEHEEGHVFCANCGCSYPKIKQFGAYCFRCLKYYKKYGKPWKQNNENSLTQSSESNISNKSSNNNDCKFQHCMQCGIKFPQVNKDWRYCKTCVAKYKIKMNTYKPKKVLYQRNYQ